MKESNAIKGFSFFTMSAGVRWNQVETYQRGHKKGTLIGLMDIHDYRAGLEKLDKDISDKTALKYEGYPTLRHGRDHPV